MKSRFLVTLLTSHVCCSFLRATTIANEAVKYTVTPFPQHVTSCIQQWNFFFKASEQAEDGDEKSMGGINYAVVV